MDGQTYRTQKAPRRDANASKKRHALQLATVSLNSGATAYLEPNFRPAEGAEGVLMFYETY